MTKEYDRHFQEFSFLHFSGEVAWPWLKAQGIAESNLDHNVVSPAGARGIMQLMPATAQEIAKHFQVVPNLDDPRTSIMFGAFYLRQMWDIFRKEQGLERLRFALGAYNAGAGNIIEAQKLAAEQGLPADQWASICAVLPRITGDDDAPETIGYVRRIEEIRLGMIEV